MKLLIVEDEIELLNSTCEYLQKEDFICETAPNFFEAEDKLITYEYDVVILDINLPDGNGLELLKLIKGKNSETGVLIVSAKNSLDDKLKGLDLGADDYITKPFHLAELNSSVTPLATALLASGSISISLKTIFLLPSYFLLLNSEFTLELSSAR